VAGLLQPVIASDEDYARRLGDGAFWEPWACAAFDLAGLDQRARLWPARPLGSYPTLLSDTGLVVKLFGDRWYGPESHQAELEAYRVLDGHDLPVPRLVAAGQLFPDATNQWPWPFLILTQLRGATYAALSATLDRAARRRVAGDLGWLLRRLHRLPLSGRRLAPSWRHFLALLERRRGEAPQDHRRWGAAAAPAVRPAGRLAARSRRAGRHRPTAVLGAWGLARRARLPRPGQQPAGRGHRLHRRVRR
jgi:hygromycin-B 7''-O-kinase